MAHQQAVAMSRRKLDHPADYEIGFGRPPKASQFQSGQSGNPTGRRKSQKPVGERLRDLINAKVMVTENGRSRRISRLDVMLRQLANDAMRGDQRAIKLLLEFLHRYGAEAKESVRSEDLSSEDLEILSEFIRKTGSSGIDASRRWEAQKDDNGQGL
jgi:hypothetical protein